MLPAATRATSARSNCRITRPAWQSIQPLCPAPQSAAHTKQTLGATGGSGNYSFSLSSGTLPSGLTLSPSGQISGTPTGGGNFSFTVKITDNSLLDANGTRN